MKYYFLYLLEHAQRVADSTEALIAQLLAEDDESAGTVAGDAERCPRLLQCQARAAQHHGSGESIVVAERPA